MAGQPRRLPQWYLDKVNMAAAVFANAPPGVSLRRPAIKGDIGGGGRGIQAQRKGAAWQGHTRPDNRARSRSSPPRDTTWLDLDGGG